MSHRELILEAYERGPEAVLALVEPVLEAYARQQEELQLLNARIKQLEELLSQNSRNSSKPPSSDQGKPKPKSLRQPSGKRSGGQIGHVGKTLTLVDEPDHIVLHEVRECAGCGRLLGDVEVSRYERRQVVDLPEPRLEVVEHRAEQKLCPGCGTETRGEFPVQAVVNVQYGPRIKALGVYLNQYQLLPLERATELIGDVFGGSFGEGTLSTAVEECFQRLEAIEQRIKQGLRQAQVVHLDETGLKVGGQRQWLHVVSTSWLTHYGVHPKRGSEATKELGILPGFRGKAVHDSWSSYYAYECGHALCNAHHLRELTFLEEELEQGWAGRMKSLLLEMKEAVEARSLESEVVRHYEERYQTLIAMGMEANPEPDASARSPGRRGPLRRSKGRKLVDRLDKRRQEVLAFLYDYRVSFDNNQAERDLRMVKVQQKVSGCFRTDTGAARFCRIRGYISTVRKQGQHVLESLEAVFRSKPFIPSL